MKREQMAQRELTLQDGTRLTLDYFLLTTETAVGEQYGIAVSDSRGERVYLPDVTSSRPYAIELLYRLAVGEVTTISAKDIVTDLLSDKRAGSGRSAKADLTAR